MSAKTLQAEVDKLRQKRKDLSNKKDDYMANYREAAVELKDELDELVAEANAAATVAYRRFGSATWSPPPISTPRISAFMVLGKIP